MKTIAAFVSPHGFGHAARTCSVLQNLEQIVPDCRIFVFSTVPHWFFADSLNRSFTYHSVQTDIGLAQLGPLKEDLQETLNRLERFAPFENSDYQEITQILIQEKCELVISDISPLGIYIANQVGIPSLLIENFTWDWIYSSYLGQYPQFEQYIDYFGSLYQTATYHILAEPYCEQKDVDLVVSPIARSPKTGKKDTRRALGIPDDRTIIIVSMGGIENNYCDWESLKQQSSFTFLIPGTNGELERCHNIIRFPHHSEFYHPDLIETSDVVISKIGYSTLAETYCSGKPYGFIPRTGFRESPVLEAYIKSNMPAVAISESEYLNGQWTGKLDVLKDLPNRKRQGESGAVKAAEFITEILNG